MPIALQLMHGREARSPSAAWIQDFSRLHDIPIDNYVEELQHILFVVWSDIAHTTALNEQQADDQAQQDAAMPYYGFDEGDLVYIKQILK